MSIRLVMAQHLHRVFQYITCFMVTICLSGCVGEMLSGQLISLHDGAIYPFKIQTSYGTGKMTAINPTTGETLEGQYTATYQGGGGSTGTIYNAQSMQYGTVSTYSSPSSAIARGYLRGDKGTIIEIHMDIQSGLRPKGHGDGIDNKGRKYQIQF